jgi:hypothetical protein
MKIFKGFFVAATTAAVCTMTSCMNNDVPALDLVQLANEQEASAEAVELGDITEPTTYKFVVKSSTEVMLDIDGSRVTTGTSYSGSAGMYSEIKIKAVATAQAIKNGYSSETINKTVKLDANGKNIYIDVPKLASNSQTVKVSDAKAQASANGSATITNSNENKRLSYSASTTANLELTSSALSKIGDDKSLAIDVENASTGKITQVLETESVEEDFAVMVVRNGVKGVSLGENAKLTINNSNFESGMVFTCSANNETKSVENNSEIEFNVNKLDDYTISCNVVTRLDEITDDTPAKGLLDVAQGGTRVVTYYTKSGYECDYNSNEFITKYLNAKFGAYTDKGKQTIEIVNNDKHASVPYEINQKVYHYTVMFGSLAIQVKVYGPHTIDINKDAATRYNVNQNL